MNIKNTLITVAIFSFLALTACTEPANVDYHAEIDAANLKFGTAFSTGDAAVLDELYTADALLLPPGAPSVSGADNRIAFWQAVMDSGVAGAELVAEEVKGTGDMATEVGRATLYDGDGNVIVTGKYIVLWKKVGEDWKLHRDIWNLDS